MDGTKLHELAKGMEFGKICLEVSVANGQISKETLLQTHPEKFNNDNSAARGYVTRKLQEYQQQQITGTVHLELRYKEGNLQVVIEERSLDNL